VDEKSSESEIPDVRDERETSSVVGVPPSALLKMNLPVPSSGARSSPSSPRFVADPYDIKSLSSDDAPNSLFGPQAKALSRWSIPYIHAPLQILAFQVHCMFA
jgi:hypothetical protein